MEYGTTRETSTPWNEQKVVKTYEDELFFILSCSEFHKSYIL